MSLSRANTELRCLIEELIVQTARQNLGPGLLDGKMGSYQQQNAIDYYLKTDFEADSNVLPAIHALSYLVTKSPLSVGLAAFALNDVVSGMLPPPSREILCTRTLLSAPCSTPWSISDRHRNDI